MGTLPFDQVIDLSLFEVANAIPKPGRPVNILEENPLQACRVLVKQSDQLIQVSERVLIQFPQKPLTVTIARKVINSVPQKIAFFQGAPLEVAVLNIANPDRLGTRVIQITNTLGPATIEIYGLQGTPSGYANRRFIVNENFLRAQPNGRLIIPAGSQVQVMMILQPNRPTLTNSDAMAVSGRVAYVELDDGGETLFASEFALPRIVMPGVGWDTTEPGWIDLPSVW